VTLDTERVIKLVFKRYDCDPHELINKGTLIDIKYCLGSVAAGITHMHYLKFVHCDLKPANIFVEANLSKSASHAYEFVVGDFDSAAVTGSKSELKAGTKHWTRPKYNGIVEEEDDWHSFRILKGWLVHATGGELEDFDGIGR
jgi:serine/threonine protein kinase